MKPNVKATWVAALRSGDYVQGKQQLRTRDNKFCVNGVLCNLHALEHPEIAATQTDPTEYLGYTVSLPPAVARWSGITIDQENELERHNDAGVSFAELADLIERGL